MCRGQLGAHVDVLSGEWTHTDAAVGVFVDSLYEYLLKGPDILLIYELVRGLVVHLLMMHKALLR